LVSRKREAAKEFYNDESNKLYIMIYKEDLKRLGCFQGARKKLREWIKSLVEKGMVTYYGGPKKEDRDKIQGKSS
jgi:hypothetical protein